MTKQSTSLAQSRTPRETAWLILWRGLAGAYNPKETDMQTIGALVRSPEQLLSATVHSPKAMAYATTMASRLIGSYPNARAHDPETFTAQVVRLFLRYDGRVVSHVVETLPSEPLKAWDGLPSLADITKALEAKAFRVSIEVEREQRVAKQISEREEAERLAEQQAATGGEERIRVGFANLRTELRDRSGLAAAETERAENQARRLNRANQLFFERECQRSGVDPAGGVTPMLRRLVGAV